MEKWASDGTNAEPTKSNVDGKPRTLDDVVYVVGSFWKQRFLVKNKPRHSIPTNITSSTRSFCSPRTTRRT